MGIQGKRVGKSFKKDLKIVQDGRTHMVCFIQDEHGRGPFFNGKVVDSSLYGTEIVHFAESRVCTEGSCQVSVEFLHSQGGEAGIIFCTCCRHKADG